jgi:hypothetical protein
MWTILWHKDLGDSDPWREWYLAQTLKFARATMWFSTIS